MDGVADELLILASQQLKGFERRKFLAMACERLCDESPRKTEARFGVRETVVLALIISPADAVVARLLRIPA